MNSRAVSFLMLVGALVAACGNDDSSGDGDHRGKGATETNVFRCGEDDLVDAGECDGGAEEAPPEGSIDCSDDDDCPDELPICNANHVCSPKRP